MQKGKSLDEKLFEDGLVWIHSGINNESIDEIIYTLMSMREISHDKPIQLYITSRSPDYTNMMAVYDTIQSLPNPIIGFGVGFVSDYGTLILASCDKGKRYALKNTVIVLSQPLGTLPSLTLQTDAVIQAQEAGENRRVFEELMAKHTGQPVEKIHADLKDGLYLTAQEALEYGIIDRILE